MTKTTEDQQNRGQIERKTNTVEDKQNRRQANR